VGDQSPLNPKIKKNILAKQTEIKYLKRKVNYMKIKGEAEILSKQKVPYKKVLHA